MYASLCKDIVQRKMSLVYLFYFLQRLKEDIISAAERRSSVKYKYYVFIRHTHTHKRKKGKRSE